MADSTDWDGSSPWLFLPGLLVFFASLVLFLYDLAVGNDVLRGIGANAVGMALLITWAAHDTLRDPNSEVATRGGAAGTALLLYGLYLILAGVTITATGLLFHDRAVLGLWYVPLAIVSIVIGFVVFPTSAVVGEDAESLDETDTDDSEIGDTDTNDSDR